jgi:RimJ/RimL family protein N-acetyltransferase
MREKTQTNELGQPIGFALPDWKPAEPPPRQPLEGRYCWLEPLDPADHGTALHEAYSADMEGRLWTYMGYGPFGSEAAFVEWLKGNCLGEDPLFYAVIERNEGKPLGLASYLRIQPSIGVIEVGHVSYAPRLQRTTAATEAMVLMARHVFEDLGYRRYEWKCDALNAGSRRAALRLGFRFEGVFRQATIYKGRNRDTAWYSIIDREWPVLREAFDAWLDPGNFDTEGRQRSALPDLVEIAREEQAAP